MLSSLCSFFSWLCSTSLFITVVAALITNVCLLSCANYKEYISSIYARIFFVRRCMARIKNNELWLQAMLENPKWSKLCLPKLEKADTIDFHADDSTDELLIQFLSEYDKSLIWVTSLLVCNVPPPRKMLRFEKFKQAQNEVLKALNIFLEAYIANRMNLAQYLWKNLTALFYSLRRHSKQQSLLKLQLEELLQEGRNRLFQ